jgi:hypothetical protein
MNSPLELFEKNLVSIAKLTNIYNVVVDQNVVVESDAEEILRAEIVLVVSAFDTYMHDLVREKILNGFFDGSYEELDFSKVDVSGDCLKKILEAKTDIEKKLLLGEEVRRLHALNSYQSPKSVEYVVGILNVKKIWSRLAEEFKKHTSFETYTGENVKSELGLIINRRNKIAHESDYNPSAFEKFSIERNDVDNVIVFMKTLVYSIEIIISEEKTE